MTTGKRIMLKQIVALSQLEAEALKPNPPWGIISIREPGGEVNLQDGWGAILKLEFHDITRYYSGYQAFSGEQAEEILDWIQKYIVDGPIDRLVVHCAAGISRSQAVALFVYNHYGRHLPELRGTEFHNILVYSILRHMWEKRNDRQGKVYSKEDERY